MRRTPRRLSTTLGPVRLDKKLSSACSSITPDNLSCPSAVSTLNSGTIRFLNENVERLRELLELLHAEPQIDERDDLGTVPRLDVDHEFRERLEHAEQPDA